MRQGPNRANGLLRAPWVPVLIAQLDRNAGPDVACAAQHGIHQEARQAVVAVHVRVDGFVREPLVAMSLISFGSS